MPDFREKATGNKFLNRWVKFIYIFRLNRRMFFATPLTSNQACNPAVVCSGKLLRKLENKLFKNKHSRLRDGKFTAD